MPHNLTKRDLRVRIGQDNGWVITGIVDSGDVNILVDNVLYSSVRHQNVRVRDVVRIQGDGALTKPEGESTFVTTVPTTTGSIELSPDLSAVLVAGDLYEIWNKDGPHPDEVDRIIDETLQEDMWRWVLTPITFQLGGDLRLPYFARHELADISSPIAHPHTGQTMWTLVDASIAYISRQWPDTIAPEYALRITASAANGYLELMSISVDPVNNSGWVYQIPILTDNPDDITIRVVDDAGGTIREDSPAGRLAGWRLIKNTFTVPLTSNSFSIRIEIQTNGNIITVGPQQIWPQNMNQFTAPPRVNSKDHIGPIMRMVGTTWAQHTFEPWQGSIERREYTGLYNPEVFIEPSAGSESLWFYELVFFPPMLTSTLTGGGVDVRADHDLVLTDAPLEWLIPAVNRRLARFLQKRDRIVAPNRWDALLRDSLAEVELMQADYGAEPMFTSDSPVPARRAVRRI